MEQQTTKPLYKRLNSERTQGEWYCEEGSYAVRKDFLSSIGSFDAMFSKNVEEIEKLPNAQYTALAVNHLHILAEALEELLNVDELNDVAKMKAQQKANKALAAIS